MVQIGCVYFMSRRFLGCQSFSYNLTVRTPIGQPCFFEHRISVTECNMWAKTHCSHSCYDFFFGKNYNYINLHCFSSCTFPQSTKFLRNEIEFNQFYNLSRDLTYHWHGSVTRCYWWHRYPSKISKLPTIGSLCDIFDRPWTCFLYGVTKKSFETGSLACCLPPVSIDFFATLYVQSFRLSQQ
jgi:hypothetical protein